MCISLISSKQHNVHPKVGLVSKEEFDTQRGGVGEETGREGEDADGDMFFPIDLQEGGGVGGGKTEEVVQTPKSPTSAEAKRKIPKYFDQLFLVMWWLSCCLQVRLHHLASHISHLDIEIGSERVVLPDPGQHGSIPFQ